MENKYSIRLSIVAEVKTQNPYQEKEMAYMVIDTLFQKGIEDINNAISNISGVENMSDMEDYIAELLERKKILTSMINDQMCLSVEIIKEVKGKPNLKIVK